jgi:hypothetical protein
MSILNQAYDKVEKRRNKKIDKTLNELGVSLK